MKVIDFTGFQTKKTISKNGKEFLMLEKGNSRIYIDKTRLSTQDEEKIDKANFDLTSQE